MCRFDMNIVLAMANISEKKHPEKTPKEAQNSQMQSEFQPLFSQRPSPALGDLAAVDAAALVGSGTRGSLQFGLRGPAFPAGPGAGTAGGGPLPGRVLGVSLSTAMAMLGGLVNHRGDFHDGP